MKRVAGKVQPLFRIVEAVVEQPDGTVRQVLFPRVKETPYLIRHQVMTYLTKKGILSPKLQLLSGHAEERSLALYHDLALSDVAGEYEEAMRTFPVR